ncbi:hypothetical protein ACFQ0B_74070 [Nonomuraea thailandensis]
MRDIGPGDLPVVTRVITESWGGTTLMVLGGGKEVDVVELPGFIAEAEGRWRASSRTWRKAARWRSPR